MSEHWTLRPDQIEDLAYFMRNPKAINGNEPGTGKTPVVCVLQRWLWDTHGVGTVWVMPLSLMKKNKDEALKFGGWTDDEVVIVDSPADLKKDGAKIFIMGFARFRLSWRDLPAHVKCLHGDEWHKGYTGHESAQTMAVYDFMKDRGEWFMPMTGTLINGKLDSAYPALQIIEPRYYGSFDAFKNFHWVIDLWTGKREGYRNHDHLREIIQCHGTARKWTDIFGPEHKDIQIELVEMEPEQRELYDKFEHDAILELEQFFIDGTLPGVAFARARQIMECPNTFPDLRFPDSNETVDLIPGRRSGKAERMDLHFTDHLENGTPFVVFSAVRRQQVELYEMARAMGIKVALINGTTPHAQRAEIDEAFRNGELQGLVVSPKVADAGFNWQFWGPNRIEVQHAIFVALDYVDTTFFQAYRRFMRETRKTALRITVMKYKNSLDFRVTQLLNRKSADAKLVDDRRELLNL